MGFYKQFIKNLPEIEDKILSPYKKQVENAKNKIADLLKKNQLPMLAIAKERDDLAEIEKLAKKITKSFKKIIILGVGGSSLGGKTLAAIARSSKVEIDFWESIDVNSIDRKLKKNNLQNSFFIVISKSGQTIETICQSLIVLERFQKSKLKISDHFIFITQNKTNSLAKIAKEVGAKIYLHPEDIGGRFSYLTIVGLLPAALLGLDLKKIRNGAEQVLNSFLKEKLEKNEVARSIVKQLYLLDLEFKNNVVMPYIDDLKDFTDWYRQLWAESLGKNNFGSTPINSMGTIDQHSQLQLYLEGPKDKFFTFVTNKNHGSDFKIKDLKNCPTLFGGKKLSSIVAAEQDSTIEVLNRKKLPIRVFELPKLNEEILSALMMQMFIETIAIAFVKNINPFDQPAVELRKELAREYLR